MFNYHVAWSIFSIVYFNKHTVPNLLRLFPLKKYVLPCYYSFLKYTLPTNFCFQRKILKNYIYKIILAPNFAGPVLAYAQTIHMSASFLSPLVNFHILDGQEHITDVWKNVFYLSGFIGVSTYGVYQIWGTGEVSRT